VLGLVDTDTDTDADADADGFIFIFGIAERGQRCALIQVAFMITI
jgi:hypothetical protein